jgi:peroxiredoxin/protein-disulfide isomerase
MRRFIILMVVLTVASLFSVSTAISAETVSFEPVRAPSKGPDNAPVTIIEIADFMWPFCKEVGPTFKRLYEEYEGKVQFVLVPYMRRYSNDSKNAALAAWAAWDQGMFWEMHDLLFQKAPYLDRPELDELARELGLDMTRFKKTMDDQTHLPELQENLDQVHELDIWSTPTTIINGRILKGAQPYENYRKIIEEELTKNSRLRASPSILKVLSMILAPSGAHAESKVFGQGKVPLYVRVPDAKPVNEPKIGELAPDFTLTSVEDKGITLSDFRGKKNVLLSFLPAAFTPVWTGQLAAYEELKDLFGQLDTQVLGVLTDNLPSLKAWAQGINVSFPILSDYWPHGHTSLKYDVLRSEGVAERAIFIIDKKGVIRYIDVHDINEDPGMNAIIRTLEEIEGKK